MAYTRIIRRACVILVLGCAFLSCNRDSASPPAPRTTTDCAAQLPQHSGEATYYTFADGSGNCGFPATPNDLMVGAMNHTDYDGSYACGTCVEVTGPDSVIDIRIVDQCPECPAGNIDLSPLAFSRIAALERGRVPISWRLISCPVNGPIVYHFKDGSNQWWTAVQIRNHRYPILWVEYLDASGRFMDVPRTDYNYFVKADGMGPGPYTFRVTDYFGHVVVDSGIVPIADSDVGGAAQFPACP
jgi:expansin (peptidoglycan-binding protein)